MIICEEKTDSLKKAMVDAYSISLDINQEWKATVIQIPGGYKIMTHPRSEYIMTDEDEKEVIEYDGTRGDEFAEWAYNHEWKINSSEDYGDLSEETEREIKKAMIEDYEENFLDEDIKEYENGLTGR